MSDLVVLTAKEAIRRHMQWRMTMQLVIASQESLSAVQMDQIRNHRRCAIGRWLDSSATLPVRALREYSNLVSKHMRFHAEMVTVAELVQADRFFEAASAIRMHSPFQAASDGLADAIMACDRVLPIAAPV